MEFDLEKEAAELAEQIAVHWNGKLRAQAPVDLNDNRDWCHELAPLLVDRLQEIFPESLVSSEIDGHKRIILTKGLR